MYIHEKKGYDRYFKKKRFASWKNGNVCVASNRRVNPKAHGESRMRCLTPSHARCSRSGGVSRMLVRSLSNLNRRRPSVASHSLSCVRFLQRRSLSKLVRYLSLIKAKKPERCVSFALMRIALAEAEFNETRALSLSL
jgi:hypothetical protein